MIEIDKLEKIKYFIENNKLITFNNIHEKKSFEVFYYDIIYKTNIKIDILIYTILLILEFKKNNHYERNKDDKNSFINVYKSEKSRFIVAFIISSKSFLNITNGDFEIIMNIKREQLRKMENSFLNYIDYKIYINKYEYRYIKSIIFSCNDNYFEEI